MRESGPLHAPPRTAIMRDRKYPRGQPMLLTLPQRPSNRRRDRLRRLARPSWKTKELPNSSWLQCMSWTLILSTLASWQCSRSSSRC